VSLVLVDSSGDVLGRLPPLPVDTPWWQEVGEVDDRYQVLRLLYGDRSAPPGGHVTYLAETEAAPPRRLTPGTVDLTPHERRAPYAEIGGPRRSMEWARQVVGARVTFRQQRTWNLSAIWRVDGTDGSPVAWLKQVPEFFAHEPVAIQEVARVAPGLVPPLMATGDEGRMLLEHVPGRDCYGAGVELREAVATAFHEVQQHFAGHPLTQGVVPQGRRDFAAVADPHVGEIDGLGQLIDGLEQRLADVEACGVPLTLVHGDLHPGNVRVDGDGRLTIMDWGDSTIDHPAFDILRLTEGLAEPVPMLEAWAARWKRTSPGSEPLRALELLRPVAALRAASTFAAFLEAIEPAEHPYHAQDVVGMLRVAASMVTS
jgi:hypothetical protein